MTLQAKCAFLLPRVHSLVIVIPFDAGLIFFFFPGRFHFPRIHNENSNESLHGRRRNSSPISTCQVVTGTVPLQVNMCQRLFDYSSRLIPPPHTPTPWVILIPGLTFATSGVLRTSSKLQCHNTWRMGAAGTIFSVDGGSARNRVQLLDV